MDHLPAVTQLLLICSLGANGSWPGGHLVQWCRRQPGRLRVSGLGLLGLEALLFYLFVFCPLAAVPHLLVFAAMIVSDVVLLSCFSEWVRILPRPWGKGEARGNG